MFGLSVKVTRERPDLANSLVEYGNYLEDLVRQYAGTATYFVLFDELDEDYRDIMEQNKASNTGP